MRVLQVIDSLRLGGAEVLVTNLHTQLLTRDVACEYYLLRSEGGALQKTLRAQGAIIHSPLQVSEYSLLHALALRAHLRKNKYDIVHVHLFPAQLWVAIVACLTRSSAVFVTTEHSTKNRRRSRRWLRWLDQWMYAQFARIACVSPEALRCLVQWCPKVAGRTSECPNGIDVNAFANARPYNRTTLLSVPPETPVALSVGTLAFVKDQATLIRAVSAVPELHLVLVGEGALRDELRKLTRSLGLEARVTFLGARNDVKEILKTADLYVQPSRWEGLPMATLEAMAAGLPLVVSDVSGLATVVGDAGLTFPVGEDQKLAAHLRLLLSDPPLRSQLSEAAAKRSRCFSIATTADRYAALYRNALTGHESGKSVENPKTQLVQS